MPLPIICWTEKLIDLGVSYALLEQAMIAQKDYQALFNCLRPILQSRAAFWNPPLIIAF